VVGAAPGRVAATFLIHGCRVAPKQAHFDVLAAEHLDPETGALAGLGAALAAGEVSRGHVDVGVRTLRQIPKRLLRAVDERGVSGAARVDEYLTEQSRQWAPSSTARLAQHLLSVLAPDAADHFDPDSFERRGVYTHTDWTGMFNVTGLLDPEGGATVATALAAFSAPHPARKVVNGDGEVVEVRDPRGKGQRQADALVDICRIALAHTHAADGGSQLVGRSPVHVTVTATTEQVAAAHAHTSGQPAPTAAPGLGECQHYGQVSTATLARLVCDATLQRVLLAPSGAVLDLGRTVRLATPAQRKAVAARDGTCAIPACTVPVALCDLHHLRSWAHGGDTDITNLVGLCPRHHTAVHAGIWTIRMHGGVPWVIPPAWADPQRRPLRNVITEATQTALQLGQQLNDTDVGTQPPPAQDPQPDTPDSSDNSGPDPPSDGPPP
jgi:hypothetical protein